MSSGSGLLLPSEAAAILRVTESTLAHWRSTGRGPRYQKIEGVIRYCSEELERYIEEKTRGTSKHARQVAVQISHSRPGRVRNHRLGGHRTKREQGQEPGNRPPAGDRRGPVGVPLSRSERVQ